MCCPKYFYLTIILQHLWQFFNYTFIPVFSNFHQNLIANQVEPKIGDTCNARLYNHYGLSIIGNRKLNRASKSNHVEDKSWYYMESIIFPLPWKILTSSRLPISRFSSRDRNECHCCNRFVSLYGIQSRIKPHKKKIYISFTRTSLEEF